MDKHEQLLQDKFQHAKENLLYNTGGNVMWSLFKFESGSVTIYYHQTDEFYILNAKDAKWFTLTEIADSWDPSSKSLVEL